MQKNTSTAKSDKTLDRLLTTVEAADILRIPANTLEKWRVAGSGPTFVKVGFRVRYHPDDLAAYLTARTRRSTSEAPA